MVYDIKKIKAPRAAGSLLRAFAFLIENPLTQKMLTQKLLKDIGIIDLGIFKV